MPHITMTPPSSAPAVAAAGAGAAAVRRELLRGMVMESTGKRTLRSEFKRDSDACGFDVLARFGGVCLKCRCNFVVLTSHHQQAGTSRDFSGACPPCLEHYEPTSLRRAVRRAACGPFKAIWRKVRGANQLQGKVVASYAVLPID